MKKNFERVKNIFLNRIGISATDFFFQVLIDTASEFRRSSQSGLFDFGKDDSDYDNEYQKQSIDQDYAPIRTERPVINREHPENLGPHA
jgi:hypothetical protein